MPTLYVRYANLELENLVRRGAGVDALSAAVREDPRKALVEAATIAATAAVDGIEKRRRLTR